jgi:hypothetical protein
MPDDRCNVVRVTLSAGADLVPMRRYHHISFANFVSSCPYRADLEVGTTTEFTAIACLRMSQSSFQFSVISFQLKGCESPEN